MISQLSPIILASKSPRRQQLLELMGLEFSVVLKDVDETYPEELSSTDVAIFIAEKKAKAFNETITNETVITADTIVCIEGKIIGKPENEKHTFDILSLLSGKKHEVITAVSLLKKHQLHSFHEVSEVYFKELTPNQIRHYLTTGHPMDKAGAYGIQEWIGVIGIEKINGSYNNVVGMPTSRLYEELYKLGVVSDN